MEDKKTIKDKDVFLAHWLEERISNQELKSLVSEKDYQTFLKLKKGLEVHQELEKPLDNSLKRIQSKINARKKPRIFNMFWPTAVAASVVILFGLFIFFKDTANSITTGYGKQKKVTLIDGSEVILNSPNEL